MKNTLRKILILFLGLSTVVATAQDVHFTQFRMAPLTLNPALAGAFSGSYRLGGLYRNQWSSTFTTPSFYIDSPITQGARKQDWIGIGGVFVSDKASVSSRIDDAEGVMPGSIKRSGFLATAAYHLSLNKKQTSVLSAGFKVGSVGIKASDEFVYETTLLGLGGGPTFQENEQGKSFLDISGGIALSGHSEKAKNYYRMGISVNHIAAQRIALAQTGAGSGGGTGRGSAKQDLWMIAHGEYGMDFTDKILFDLAGMAQFLGSASEIAVQGRIGYRINQETVGLVGVGYRLGDAAAVLVGLEHKSVRVGFAYDLNLSSLTAPNSATEFAVSYIGKIFKRPKIDPVIFCPRF